MPCVCKSCGEYDVYALRIMKSSQMSYRNYCFSRVNLPHYYEDSLEKFTKYLVYENIRSYFCGACSVTDMNLIVDRTRTKTDGFCSSTKGRRSSNDRYTCTNCGSGNVYEIVMNGHRINLVVMNGSTNKTAVSQDFRRSGLVKPIKWLNEVYYCPKCVNISSVLLDWDAVDEDRYRESPWARELDYLKLMSEIRQTDNVEDTDTNSEMLDM